MTPVPQEASSHNGGDSKTTSGERIVISGMSGLFPSCYNIRELSELLYNKDDPSIRGVPRFSFKHPEMVTAPGYVPDLGTFDGQFFKVHYRLGNMMDPMARKMLEHAYQAIYDAGINPGSLSGKKVGVYIGTCFSESEKCCFYGAATRNGFGIAGCSKTMFANRISYWLNAKGPSMSIDEACCSSIAALEQAYHAISRGECEAAVVGGAYLCLHPQSSVHYGRIMKLCKDGKTKSFDENADGCGKAEAINILFLQKAKNALRIYGEVLHTKTEFISLLEGETGPKFGFYRDINRYADFLKRFYEELKMKPQAVEYVEAFGSAVPEADKVELETIDQVFCEGKKDVLLVGSVMSNIGYSEAATGSSGITKVLLGYHTGKLAANLHCANPRQDVLGLRDGRMQILTEHQPFQRGLAAVNILSVTGLNSHVLLHGNYKPKDLNKYKTNIPHLVTVSGRHEEAVKYVLDELKSHPIDPEQIALLHNIHRTNVAGHLGRGYTILDTDESQSTVSVHEEVDYYDDMKRPLWFVYSGMGSQWPGMGTELLRIPIFAAAIQRCQKALEPKGLDLLHIITTTDEKIFDNILHSFVGIAAVQIGLTDVLNEVGLKPQGIIGHSVGELGCAYADGCLTAEEMILAAYSRGLVSLETSLIHGSMAAVGLGYKEISKICPPEIDVACHNSADSSTISGPADVMKDFVAKLTADGVFAKEVPCSNIAYHSRYIAGAGPSLLKYLKEVIKSPKPRSRRWVSTSVPENKWNEPSAKFCSPEYQTNNLLSSVLFEESTKYIPRNAVLVEVAPHGLLQAILKRSMSSEVKNIALTRRKHRDNVLLVLQALGQLYMDGFHPKIEMLYPKVEFPVSTGTPFLSHLIKWAHGEKWTLALYSIACRKTSSECNYVVSYHDEENEYLRGNRIRGKILYPFAAALVLVWDTFTMVLGVPRKSISIKFTDLHLYTQPILHDRRGIKLNIVLHRGTGCFEVLNDDSKVVSGYIQQSTEPHQPQSNDTVESMHRNTENLLRTDDIYRLLQKREYMYSGDFRSLDKLSTNFDTCEILWRDNWVTFIDGMLQLNTLRLPYDGFSVPSLVRSISIDLEEHTQYMGYVPAVLSNKFDYTRCGGVKMENITFEYLPTKINRPAIITKEISNEVKRHKEHAAKIGNYKLECAKIGDYESLTWVETPQLSNNGIPVTVHYVGINLHDMKTASGHLLFRQETKNTFGLDFSGVTDNGQGIMGLMPTGAACRRINAVPHLSWPVPKHWSLEDAATVPMAYTLAFYCCSINFKLMPHNTVYVHGGSGALGQAVISLALASGCKVLTGVSDIRKKHFLKRLFPELKDENIGASRDPNFSDFILSATNGAGCDLIINTAVGDMKHNATKACAQSGLVIDLTQIQDRSMYYYGMNNLTRARSYMALDLHSIFYDMEIVAKLQTLMSNGISRGFVRPLSRVTYAACHVSRAFRLLAASQHRGRVLLQLGDTIAEVKPRMSCSPDAYHLLVCNGHTFGLEVADRLIARGARKLCVYYKNTSDTHFLAKKRCWENKGVQVALLSDLNDVMLVQVLLKQIQYSGGLEGLFFVTENQSEHKLVEVIDKESRKFNINPKYFAVFNIGQDRIGEDICNERARMGLNTVNLLMPRHHAMANSEALDITECKLLSPSVTEDTDGLVAQVMRLADIQILKDSKKYATLTELGLGSSKIPLISYFLRTTYNIVYSEEKIASLSINSLLELEKELTEVSYQNTEGWSNFFKFVGTDELLAATEMVCMPTLGNGSAMRDDEFDLDRTYLCIVPGIEGHHSRFHTLCQTLKLPALVMQPSLDCPHDSMHDTARKMTQVMLTKGGLKNNFCLLGYESGVILALEMAAMLENYGMTGTVFCLGYTPKELKKYFDSFISKFSTEEELQESLLKHMSSLISGTDAPTSLQGSWEAKLDACIRGLLGRVPHSVQYTRALIETALMRVNQLKDCTYELPQQKLRSKIILMRAKNDFDKPSDDLQQYSEQKLTVYQLSAPLADVALDLKCAAIINSCLDPIILKEFYDRNICDSYLLNGNAFINIEIDE